jgi:hypothetical protein
VNTSDQRETPSEKKKRGIHFNSAELLASILKIKQSRSEFMRWLLVTKKPDHRETPFAELPLFSPWIKFVLVSIFRQQNTT